MGVVGTHHPGVARDRARRLEPRVAGSALDIRRYRRSRHRLRRPVVGRAHAGSAARRHGFVPVHRPVVASPATRARSASALAEPHRRQRTTRHTHEVTDFDAVARPRRDKREQRTDRRARRRHAVSAPTRSRHVLARGRRGGTHADRTTRPGPRTATGRRPPTPGSRPQQCTLADRRARWSDPAPGSLPDSEDGPVQPRTAPERVVHAKGAGAHGFFECTVAVHKRDAVPRHPAIVSAKFGSASALGVAADAHAVG
jgi:hypothetical protein